MIRLKMMCDKCLRVLGDNEPMYGFKLYDDEGTIRAFKGHKECIEDIQNTLTQLYGISEGNKDEEGSQNPEQ